MDCIRPETMPKEEPELDRDALLAALGDILLSGRLSIYSDSVAGSLKRKLRYAFTPGVNYSTRRLEKLVMEIEFYLSSQTISSMRLEEIF